MFSFIYRPWVRIWVGVFIMALGAFYTLYFVARNNENRHFLATSEKTTGTVVDVYDDILTQDLHDEITVRYITMDGKVVIFKEQPIIRCWKNERIDVYYDPNNPQNARTQFYYNEIGADEFYGIFTICFGGLVFWIGKRKLNS